MKRWLLALTVAATFAHAQPFPFETEADRKPKTVTSGNCLIRGARVLTVTNGTLENGDVLVKGGKIAAIGRNLQAPEGFVVIDGRGKTLAPGIVDGHSHRGSDGTNEGAESVTCEVRISDVLNPGAFNVWQAVASGHTAALILHGSANSIGGESVVVKYKYERPVGEFVVPDAPRQVKFALGENVTRKSSRDTNRFPRSRMGVEAVYRRVFEEAKQYAKSWKDFESGASKIRPRRDLRLQTLADILAKKVWVQCHSYRSDEMLMMVRLSQEFGFKIGALQHALEAYKIAPELAQAGVPVSIFVDNWSFKVESYDAIPWNAAICHQAGVNVSINTDGVSGTSALNIDAAKVMRFGGLSEDEALRMVTLNPAIQLGIDHRTGSIEVGKDADLVLWSGHPLSVYSKVAMTMIEGDVYFERRDAFGIDSGFEAPLRLPRQAHRGSAPPLRKSSTYAIVGAEVHTVSGPVIRGGTVVVRDGRIAAVGRDVAVPSGATFVPGKGLRVYPGWFDGSTSLGLAEISPVATMVDNSELGSIQPDLDAATALWVESAHFGPAVANGVTNAFTSATFGTVSGQGAVIHLEGKTPEELTLARRAALAVGTPSSSSRFGEFDACHDVADASWLLGLGGHEDELLGDEGLSASDRDRFFDLMGGAQEVSPGQESDATPGGAIGKAVDDALAYYKQRQDDPATPVNLGFESMRPYLEEKRLIVVSARTPGQIRAAVEVATKHRLNMALRGASGAWREADLLRRSGVPVIISPAGRSTLGANTTDNPWDPYDTPYVAPALLAKAGVRFCFGTGGAADVMNLAIRAGQHCAYGLTQEQAVRALTLDAAKIFGVDRLIGSIEPGKIANLVVTDGDPFELTTSYRYVFVKGQPAGAENKHTRLRDKYQARRP